MPCWLVVTTWRKFSMCNNASYSWPIHKQRKSSLFFKENSMKNLDHRRRQTMISGRKKNIPHSLPPLQNHVVSLNLCFHSALIKTKWDPRTICWFRMERGYSNNWRYQINKYDHCTALHCTVRNWKKERFFCPLCSTCLGNFADKLRYPAALT